MSRDGIAYGVKARLNYRAEKGKSIIDEKYAFLTGIHEVYSVLGISESHFRHSFESAFGTSPKLYLETVQIEKAKELLIDNSMKVYEVGERVGFKHGWADMNLRPLSLRRNSKIVKSGIAI